MGRVAERDAEVLGANDDPEVVIFAFWQSFWHRIALLTKACGPKSSEPYMISYGS